MFPGTCRVPLGTQVLFKSGHAVQGASSAVSQNFKSDGRREPTPFVVMRKVSSEKKSNQRTCHFLF